MSFQTWGIKQSFWTQFSLWQMTITLFLVQHNNFWLSNGIPEPIKMLIGFCSALTALIVSCVQISAQFLSSTIWDTIQLRLNPLSCSQASGVGESWARGRWLMRLTAWWWLQRDYHIRSQYPPITGQCVRLVTNQRRARCVLMTIMALVTGDDDGDTSPPHLPHIWVLSDFWKVVVNTEDWARRHGTGSGLTPGQCQAGGDMGGWGPVSSLVREL